MVLVYFMPGRRDSIAGRDAWTAALCWDRRLVRNYHITGLQQSRDNMSRKSGGPALQPKCPAAWQDPHRDACVPIFLVDSDYIRGDPVFTAVALLET